MQLIAYLLIVLGCAFCFRVRGGLRIPHTDKKFPLNKYWFAIFFALSACFLRFWSFNFFLVTAIAARLSTQIYGWGEYIGCLLCGDKPSGERSDCDLVDDIVDNLKITFHGNTVKLSDYPVAWGWLGLSLRGLILSFIIGLALNSIPFMLCGFAMGTVYWLGGQFNKLIDDGKCGWKWAEWLFGGYLGLMLCLFA